MSDTFLDELLSSVKAQAPNSAKQVETKAMVSTTVESNDAGVKTVIPVTDERQVVTQKMYQNKVAYVSFDSGATINLGNFNMGKTSVSISIPVGMEITDDFKKKLEDTYGFAKAFCEKKLEEEVGKLMKVKGKL